MRVSELQESWPHVPTCAYIAVCGTSDQCCVHTHNGVSGDVGCSHGVKVMGLKDRKLSSGFGSCEGRERAFRVGSQQLSMGNDGMRRDKGHGHDGNASGRSTEFIDDTWGDPRAAESESGRFHASGETARGLGDVPIATLGDGVHGRDRSCA